MGTPENVLPFPRGRTACDGFVTPTAALYSQLMGQVYEVHDTVHGTGQKVKLRAMKLEADITVARKFFKPGTTALDFGRTIAALNNSAGGVAWALDDAYTVGDTLLANDVVYFIDKGPVYLRTETSSVSLAQGGGVVSDGSGLVDGAAPAAGNVVLGRIDEACTTTNTLVVVHIDMMVGGEGT